ncbi:MAG: beta-lactamase family protein [Nostocaceae cyanobacterium CSU_2_110]|nr:beta-lactamase family protein [Nostocaceae cyanobacterium CSU_2_110]
MQNTLETFFPDAPDDKAMMTIEHLLTHASGLTEHSDGDLVPMTRDEAVSRIFALDLAFAPGTAMNIQMRAIRFWRSSSSR